MNYDILRLESQLCFPLYICSKEIVRIYKPYLDKVGLTYPQYITMMALWEHKKMPAKRLGELLYLDSGTLTPLLKKLEKEEYIKRARNKNDERTVIVNITKKGMSLKEKAIKIPYSVGKCISLTDKEKKDFHRLLYKVIDSLK